MSNIARQRSHSKLLATLSLLAFLVALLAPSSAVLAQRGGDIESRPLPSPHYYNGVTLLEAGDFSAAANFYRQELKHAFRIGNQLWIDSICYYAMIGESCYQAGDLNEALTNYNAALAIATTYPQWIGRVTFAGGVSTRAKGPAPWGGSRRPTPLGVFPNKATITIGDKINDDRLKQSGIVSEQKQIPIDPLEILRCTALCVRRRSEILGPLAPFDPISQQILETFRKRAVAPNHWSNTLLDVIWAFALEESDKASSALNTLNDALALGGASDHVLTGQALFEMGNIFMKADKIREAAQCYYEASISAYHYGDNLLVEEAIRNYSNATKALRGGGEDPVVNLAYRWAKSLKNAQTLTASFGLELVEEFIDRGKLNLATSGLGAIDKTMRATAGRGLRQSRAADRWNYLNALLFYANGNIADGDLALAKVVEGCKLRSPWALQLLRLDNYVKGGLSSNGALTPRNAADLYEYLLREPTAVDWAVRPTESLALQMIAPPDAYERWFCILMDRDLKDKAFEVAERVRRERFFRTQTYGGRLISLRYILTADDALTTASIRNARQSLLFAYPAFAELLQESQAVTNDLNSIPTVPTDGAIKTRQTSLFARLADVSLKQEALMRFIAAGRIRIPYVFPPVYSVADVQKRLPEDTAILSFIDAEGETFGFMIGKDNLDAWRVGSTSKLAAAVGVFLKTIGNTEGTRQLEASTLTEAHWKSQGARLREIVLGAQDVDADRFNIMFSKLAVVPDGALWYLPFEALCLPAMASTAEEAPEDDSEPLDAKDLPHVLDAVATDDAETSDGEEEEEDDLDSAYLATEDEAAEIEAEEEAAKELEEALADDEDAQDEEEEVKDAEPAAPVKRKSRSARQREELEAYEATLIPMIQASELSIRYSATVSLALPNALGRNAFVETTVAAGHTYPKEAPETIEAAVDRFAATVSKTEAFRIGSIELPGAIYAARLKRLVVLDEIVGNIWNWTPLSPGRNLRGPNRASDWIAAPWGAPRLFVAPALRTRAEEALKNGGDGSELFLPILAMQASGADAMLLSRWRTGGRSAFDLTTDFVKNYESMPTPDAYKYAALKLMNHEVVVEEEPRLRKLGRSEATPNYDSPFWWAGYMVVDSGEAVKAEDLEKFDEANVAKAEEENALLEGGVAEEGAYPDAAATDDKSKKSSSSKSKKNAADDANNADEAGSDEDGLDLGAAVESVTNAENDDSDGDDSDDATSSDEDEEGVITPSFVTPNKTSSKPSAPLDLNPKKLSDDELADQDEEGDDFFATDEEEDEPVEDENADAETSDAVVDDEEEAQPEESEGLATDEEDAQESAPAADDEEEDALDTDDFFNDEDEDAKPQPKSQAKTSTKVEAKPAAKATPTKAAPTKAEPAKTEPAKAEPKKATATATVKPAAKSANSASGEKPSKQGKITLKPKS